MLVQLPGPASAIELARKTVAGIVRADNDRTRTQVDSRRGGTADQRVNDAGRTTIGLERGASAQLKGDAIVGIGAVVEIAGQGAGIDDGGSAIVAFAN